MNNANQPGRQGRGQMNNNMSRGNARGSSAPQNNRGSAQSQRSAGGAPQRPPQRNNMGQASPMSRISRQTPQNRRSEPRAKVKLTAEQIEINRINRQREKYYINKRRTAKFKTYVSRFALFLVVFVLMFGAVSLAFYANLTYSKPDDSSGYSYVIGGEKHSLSYAKAVRDGRVYVNFSKVAEMCGLALVGSEDDVKYVIKGEEPETIRFIPNTLEVYINNVPERLGAKSYYENGELFVPVDFIAAYFKGLNIQVDERSHKVTVERVITNLNANGKLDKGVEPVYGELSFLLQAGFALDPIKEEDAAMATLPDLGFVTNLSVYEEYMNPGNTDEFLTLVNKTSKLPSNYTPQDLVEVEATRDDGRAKQMLRRNAAMALEALFKEMRAAGFEDVSVTSAYRSYSYQESIFNGYLAQHNNDYDYVSTFSNPPGASEHQTGLCVDMHNLPGADKVFANEPAYAWLKENCWKFGFILRYPQDKFEATGGIDFEPWHYRYVGRYHAQRMYQMNMCLEEYLAYINGAQ